MRATATSVTVEQICAAVDRLNVLEIVFFTSFFANVYKDAHLTKEKILEQIRSQNHEFVCTAYSWLYREGKI